MFGYLSTSWMKGLRRFQELSGVSLDFLIDVLSNLVLFFRNINHPAGNYIFKVNIWNTRASYEICSKLTIKTPEQRHVFSRIWSEYGEIRSISPYSVRMRENMLRRSCVFIANFEHISYLVLVFLLLTLSR